jgi:triacylglycerol esterase/lipase EstA (alpha/beta hydrolase family)
MLTMRSLLLLIVLTCALLSCGGTAVRTVVDDDWLNRPVTMDRNRQLPAQLTSHLAFLGLDDGFVAAPWPTLSELDRQWRAFGQPVADPQQVERHAVLRKGISYVLAAAAYQHAVTGDHAAHADHQLRAMTTAMVAAYTFLFEPLAPYYSAAPEALDERTNDAREIYNRSLSWLALYRQNVATVRGEEFTLPMVSGALRLKSGAYQLPYPLASARRFDACYALHGIGNEPPVIQRGLGAPMIVRFEQRENEANLACAATFVVRLAAFPLAQEELAGEWLVLDPLRNLRVPLIEQQPPTRLEADLTTPLQVLASELPASHRSSGFFDGDQVGHLAGITMLEPYVAGRIPLILVHGTMATPDAWLPLLASLRGDPWLRDRYQVWFFRYPTSNPIAASATLLRDSIAAQVRRLDPRDEDPAMHNMIVMGHSMGGLISRLVVIDSDDQLRGALAPDLPAGDAGSALLTRCTTFSHEKRITRVVYIGTPHRGVELLDAFWLDGATRWLELPKESADLAAVMRGGERTSLHNMRPGSQLLTWLATKPAGIAVKINSVVGELGAGNDGLVSYQSAHLSEVESEVILPVDHGQIYKCSAAIVELRRILDRHANAR